MVNPADSYVIGEILWVFKAGVSVAYPCRASFGNTYCIRVLRY